MPRLANPVTSAHVRNERRNSSAEIAWQGKREMTFTPHAVIDVREGMQQVVFSSVQVST